MGDTIACMISTIGRPTLAAAVRSALDQFDEVIVIADDTDLEPGSTDGATVVRTGRRFDRYGSAAWNVGAYTTTCDWIAQLGDDDEWRPDAADVMRERITSTHTVDVWVPGLRYNDSNTVCMRPGLQPGNVAAPICRPEAYFSVPMTAKHARMGGLTDYAHIVDLDHNGHRIGWIGDDIYLVRPHAPGRHGGGQP